MGSWKLEVGKMFFYVMFPVAAFHIFNQPGIFESLVVKHKESDKQNDFIEKLQHIKREYGKRLQEKKKMQLDQ